MADIDIFTRLSVLPDGDQALNVMSCNLSDLPSEVYHLEQLNILFAKGNQLTNLDQQFVNLKELRKIDLEQNRISTFPTVVCNFEHLTFLIYN